MSGGLFQTVTHAAEALHPYVHLAHDGLEHAAHHARHTVLNPGGAGGPYRSLANPNAGELMTVGNPALERASSVARVANTVLSPLAMAGSVSNLAHGVAHRDAGSLVHGGVGAAAALPGTAAAASAVLGAVGANGAAAGAAQLAAAANPVGMVASAGLAGYGAGRLLDHGVGHLMGGERQVTGRDGSASTERDTRTLSDRIGDAAGGSETGGNIARTIAPYLPRFLGGDGWLGW